MIKRLINALQLLARPDVLLDLHIYGGTVLFSIAIGQLHWALGVGSLGAILFGLGFLRAR